MPLTPTPPPLNQMVEAVTAAAIAAVDRHLAHMGLCPAPIVPHTGSVAPTTYFTAVPPNIVPPFARTAPVAQYTGSVSPTTYPSAVPPNTVPPFARIAPIAQYTGPVAPTTYPAAISPDTIPPFMSSSPVAPLPPSIGNVNPYIYPSVAPAPVSTLPPADPVVSIARPAPAPTRTPSPTSDPVRLRFQRPLDTDPP